MEATATPQNGVPPIGPTGLGQATMPAPVLLPPISDATPPGPAAVADTTPIVLGMEIPPPSAGVPGPLSTDNLAPPNPSAIVPVTGPPGGVIVTPGYVPAPITPAPAASPLSSVPTWAWVLGGAALLGLLGFIAWTAMHPAVAPASRSNPLMRGEATRRRFRRVRRAKRRGR